MALRKPDPAVTQKRKLRPEYTERQPDAEEAAKFGDIKAMNAHSYESWP